MSRITVLGSGSWGTALALALTRSPLQHPVTLWCHRPESAAALAAARENTQFLPGFPIPPSIHIAADDAQALETAEILVSAIPSEFLRPSFARLAPHLRLGQILISTTKGIEDHTHLRMTQVMEQAIAQARAEIGMPPLNLAIGALSGPSFAQEVAAAMPTAITIAFPSASETGADDTIALPSVAHNPPRAQQAPAARIQQEFSSATLRLYTSTDLIGVELGGALKNVIAIAVGVAAGAGLGHNSTAALITRGIAEISRLAIAAGARRETLVGLSGLGDLILTSTGSLSRNRTVGYELGRGRRLQDILQSLGGKVAEGVRTTRAALGLAHALRVEMPIAQQMRLILDQNKNPIAAIQDLMRRPQRDED